MKEPISSEKPIAVTSDGFSRQIIRRHAGFGSFVQHFHPLISTGGIIPLLGRWIELIYAMPFFSIRREITTQRIESMTDKINQPVSLILNFLLNFSEQQHIFQSQSRLLDETLKKLAITMQRSYFFQPGGTFASPVTSLLSLSRAIIQLHRERDQLYESRDRSQVSTYTQSVLSETSRPVTEQTNGISPEEKRQKFSETLVPLLLTVRYNPMLLSYQLPTIIHIARESAISPAARRITESLVAAGRITVPLVTTRQITESLVAATRITVPLVTTRQITESPVTVRRITAPLVAPLPKTKGEREETPGYSRLTTDRVDSASSRQARSLTLVPTATQGVEPIQRVATQREAVQREAAQREAAEGSQLNVLKLTKIEPAYRTYPAMETITSRENPQIIRETQVIEKEVATKQPPQPKIDIERLTEEVYRLFERRVKIERERRGL